MTEGRTEEAIKEKLEGRFGTNLSNWIMQRTRRMYVEVPREALVEVVDFAKGELGFDHLSTITGSDAGEHLELIYHLFAKGLLLLNLKTKLPLSDPKVRTITHLFPGAEPYERELEDMLGATVEGLPPGRHYPLPEDFPPGQHPLRKSWKVSDAYPQEV
jgi:NADH:ubiquinone oxidoreductase subunit C